MKFEIKLTGIKLLISILLIILPCLIFGSYIILQNDNDPDLLIRNRKILFQENEKDLSGPWGDLEVIPITLQPPINIVSDYHSLLEVGRDWNFKNTNLDTIRELFLNAGIPWEIIETLIKNTKQLPNGGGYITSPPDSILLNFSSEIRAKLYPLIGKFTDNPTYTYPLFYPSTEPNDWFLAGNLPQDLVKRIKSLIYIRNNMCCISDLHLVVPYIKNPMEKNNLMQIMFRTQALEVFLKIREGQDIIKLAEYWGTLGGADRVAPILESIRSIPGGGRIDIVHLLPPIPRVRLNTYVSVDEYFQNLRNCHWATFNFFNEQSDEQVSEFANLNPLLKAIAKPLPEGEQPKLGDMILNIDNNNQVVHSCVYIAGDIVYTKDGTAPDRPFKLSYLDNVLASFVLEGGLKTMIFSRNVANTNKIRL